MFVPAAPGRWKYGLNFFAIYVIWGSTYLAIKYAIVSFPPFLLSGLRYFLAGLILLAFAAFRRENRVAFRDLRIAALSGFLLVSANALVCFAELRLASGIVAVVIGTMPGWIMLLNWQFFDRAKPTVRQAGGAAIALAGIVLLSKDQLTANTDASLVSWAAIGLSMLCWALGTLIQRRSGAKDSFFLYSSAQLSLGGLCLLFVLLFIPSARHLDLSAIEPTAWAAFGYLTLFGSVIAFTSYLWLSRHVSPTIVSTYAIVNPAVAMMLGVFFAGERLTGTTVAVAGFILFGLYFVVIRKKPVSAGGRIRP